MSSAILENLREGHERSWNRVVATDERNNIMINTWIQYSDLSQESSAKVSGNKNAIMTDQY